MMHLQSYRRGMKATRRVVGLLLSLSAFCASSMAQQSKACIPDNTFAQVGSLVEKQDYQAAKRLLRGLESCPHLSPVQQFNVGWLYGKAHDSSEALRFFKSVPEDVPNRLTHGYAIALASFELGQYQTAIDTLIALRSAGVFDAKCADLLGVSYAKLEKYQDAYTVMAENIRQNPSNPYGYFNLITLFVDTSEMDKAAEVAGIAIAAFPQSAEALQMRGSIELYQNQLDDAYRDFAAAAKFSPQAADPRFFMALVDYRQARFDDAAKVLKDAIALGIADSDLHYMLAECALRVNATDSRTALSELDQAIQLNESSVSARVLRGMTLLDTGRPADAVVDLKRALDLNPNPQRDTRNAKYLLGRAYVALGRPEEAKLLFSQVGHQAASGREDALNQLSEQKIRAALHP
jgi:tetratricopeptide (TPR) repeat protein